MYAIRSYYGQRLPGVVAGGLQVARQQLARVQEFVGIALVDQDVADARAGAHQAGRVPGFPGAAIVTEIGAETSLAPGTGDRVGDRRERRYRAIRNNFV